MSKNEDRREAVEAADVTGMVANQELLATFPAEELHDALPLKHPAHATIDAMHHELGSSAPNAAALKERAGALRSIQELEATIANWWDSPTVQRIVMDLTQIGL